MFPNLRLLIGALLASVVTLCCGFGVFAAFRVSHEPLSRLPAATAPLQLVINEAAAPRPTWGAPIGGLLAVNVSDVGGAAAVRPVISSARPATAVKTAAVIDASRQHTSPPTTQKTSLNPTAPATQTPPAAAKPAAVVAPSSTAASPPPSAAAVPAPVASSASTPPPDKRDAAAKATIVPLVTADAVKANIPPPQTLPANSDVTPPAPAAVATIDPAPPGAQPAESSDATPEAAGPAANSETKPAETVQPAKARKAIAKPVRRVAARRRLVRKPRAPVVAQFGGDTATFHDPVFQSAPDTQTRRATRTSSAKKAANSDTTSNSFSWPNAQ
jgi:hypothetical protein